jgi:hypothetical protein
VNAAPDWGGARKQTATFVGEPQDAAASIVWVWRHFDQAATFKGLQSGSERGSIHCEQRRYWPHGWRLGAIEGHQERKLAVGQFEGAQCVVEAPRQGTRGTLNVKTETAISHEERGLVRKQIRA